MEELQFREWTEEAKYYLVQAGKMIADAFSRLERVSKEWPPTIAEATPSADTPASLSVAPVQASIDPPTRLSSPSAPPATESGPAEPFSGCAHEFWAYPRSMMTGAYFGTPRDIFLECTECGASQVYVKTAARDVGQGSSTSQKPDSRPSVAHSRGASARFISKELGEV